MRGGGSKVASKFWRKLAGLFNKRLKSDDTLVERGPLLRDDESERQATIDAIGRLRKTGANLSKGHRVDFHVAAPTESAGQLIARDVSRHGFDVDIVAEEKGDWTVWCTKSLMLEEPVITQTEELLQRIAEPYEGYIDGWGTDPVK